MYQVGLLTCLMHLAIGTGYAYDFQSTETGFCDFESQNTDHGFYNWTETEVGQTDMQSCEFGPKKEYEPDGKAKRMCAAHREWEQYDGEQCITRRTHELQRLVS